MAITMFETILNNPFPVLTPVKSVRRALDRNLRVILDENPELGTRQDYTLFRTADIETPVAIGSSLLARSGVPYFARKINYDPSELTIFDEDELGEIVRHELSHVYNGDTYIEDLAFINLLTTEGNETADELFEQIQLILADTQERYAQEQQTGVFYARELQADTTLCRDPAAAIRALEKFALLQEADITAPDGRDEFIQMRIDNLREHQRNRAITPR